MCFDFPSTGRRVDGREDKCEIAGGDVSGADDSEFCLLVDVGDDGED